MPIPATQTRRVSPAWVLFFLSPAIGELLSGSSPPAKFFNPFALTLLALLYGGGALLVRELTHRWRRGWTTLLVLGAAYGIAEEGLMVKSFFDPHWVDLGKLGSYGRWAGVNWVWSLDLTLYHAVFSIAIPILLVDLMFPDRRSESWISSRTFTWLGALWVAEIAFGFTYLTPYRPPLGPYLLALVIVLALLWLAPDLSQPMATPDREKRIIARPWRFACAGFLATFVWFFFVWGLPNSRIPPLGTMLLTAGLAALAAWLLVRMSGGGAAWSARHQLALASGALGFFILLAPVQELDMKNRPDNTAGMILVGLAAVVFLIWLARRVGSLESGRTAPERA